MIIDSEKLEYTKKVRLAKIETIITIEMELF
jgi:hypothetical protein